MWRLEITITHISLPHTHPCIVLRVHNPHEADGERGVCMLCDPVHAGWISSAAVPESCGDKVPIVSWLYWKAAVPGEEPAAPELLLTFASGSVKQLLLVLLPFLVWFYMHIIFMLQRDTKEPCTNPSHPQQHLAESPRSCCSPLQRTDFFIEYQQSMDVLVHQAQQGTMLHHE